MRYCGGHVFHKPDGSPYISVTALTTNMWTVKLAKLMSENVCMLFQLHIAACCGYTRVVQFLISHQVDLGALDNDAWQPIHCAGYWAQVSTVYHSSFDVSSH